jgi:transcriptional regulator NrdR family protein
MHSAASGMSRCASTASGSTMKPGEDCQLLDCNHENNRVIDSRPGRYKWTLRRRRRECYDCGHRFSTVEISSDSVAKVQQHEFELWIERRIASARTQCSDSPAE